MKILLSLLGTIVMTSSSVVFATSNVYIGHKQQIEVGLDQKDSDIDWKVLKAQATNYFDNFKNQKLFSNEYSQPLENEEAINYAKEKAFSYIEQFSEKNLNLEEIINQISDEIPEFKEAYNKSLNESLTNPNNLSNINLTSFLPKEVTTLSRVSDYPEDLRKVVKNLKIAKASFATTAALAAFAAVGFWAGAWWFGFTVPFAVACTTASTVCTLIAVGLEKVVNIAAPQANDPLLTVGQAYSVGKAIKYGVDNLLKGTKSVLTGIQWAFAAIGAVFSIYTAVGDWLDVFN